MMLTTTAVPRARLMQTAASVTRSAAWRVLADSNYVLQLAQTDFPKLRFHFSSEF